MRAFSCKDTNMAMTIPQIKELLDKADEVELQSLERALAADTRKGVVHALKAARKRLEAQRAESERLKGLYEFEESLLGDRAGLIVGLDEVGRGSVAGPLAVGAVVLERDSVIEGLNDSKKISPEHRTEIAARIKACCRAWTVVYIEPAEIDRDGMTLSLKRAFTQALKAIDDKVDGVELVLVDGNPLHIDSREINVIKGDGRCATIAAASIVAKTERDALMVDQASEYPQYGLDVNKGYASPQHIEAIREYGISDIHRASFCRSFMQETLF